MKELSLHILDIVQNSIAAEATKIDIEIIESTENNSLVIKIVDNGKGMSKELLQKVVSPFVTTRTTRKIGLGISLFKAAAERCNGYFTIDSKEGKGTSMEVAFQRDHIDRAPLGSMSENFVVFILSNDKIDYSYSYILDDKSFTIDTKKIRKILGEGVELSNPEVLDWIKNYVLECQYELKKSINY